MSENKAAESQPSEPPKKTEPPKTETKTFTQEDLDKIVGGVRTDVKTAYEKEIAKIKEDFEKERKLSSLKEEERAKVEKEMELKKLNDELAASRRELALKSAEAELAKGELSVSFAAMVLGKDAEETAKNIDTLRKQIDAEVKKALDANLKTRIRCFGRSAKSREKRKVKGEGEKKGKREKELMIE